MKMISVIKNGAYVNENGPMNIDAGYRIKNQQIRLPKANIQESQAENPITGSPYQKCKNAPNMMLKAFFIELTLIFLFYFTH